MAHWDQALTYFYQEMNGKPFVKWKDSIKAIMGIPTNEQAGMDVTICDV